MSWSDAGLRAVDEFLRMPYPWQLDNVASLYGDDPIPAQDVCARCGKRSSVHTMRTVFIGLWVTQIDEDSIQIADGGDECGICAECAEYMTRTRTVMRAYVSDVALGSGGCVVIDDGTGLSEYCAQWQDCSIDADWWNAPASVLMPTLSWHAEIVRTRAWMNEGR